MKFWLSRGGVVGGPFEYPQLLEMAFSGVALPGDFVRHEYSANWVTLGGLPGLDPSVWRHYRQASGLSVFQPRSSENLFDTQPDPTHVHDVVVIGSGFGGGTLAYRLALLGLDVLVVEAGGILSTTHAANSPRLHVQGSFSNFWEVYDHCLKSYTTREQVPGESHGYTGGQAFCLGGRSVFWGGVSLRMQPYEFAGWPPWVAESLLHSYYAKAEEFMGVSTAPASDYTTRFCQFLVRVMGGSASAQPTPMAVRFAAPPALGSGMFSLVDLLVELHLSRGYGVVKPKIVLRHPARLLQSSGNSIVSCHLDDLSGGHRTTVRGRIFVAAAGTVESARLMMASGIGGRYLGRGITDHKVSYCRFVIPSTSPFYSGATGTKVTLQHLDGRSHPYNALVTLGSDLFLSRYRGRDLEQRDAAARSGHMLGEIVFLHQSPLLEGNALSLTDPRGDQPLRLSMQPQGLNAGGRRECDEIASRVILSLGGRPIDADEIRCTDAQLGNVAHEVGTLRMGQHPEMSVVDPDLRVHGIENLYVCDLSVFPSSPPANPSLTLASLALRLADRIYSYFPGR